MVLLRFNTYTVFVSAFIHLLCGVIFLMSQGHLATGSSFIVFSTAGAKHQRVFLKDPKTAQAKKGRKKKAKKKRSKVKGLKSKRSKKKSFPEKPRGKDKKEKGKAAERVEEVRPLPAPALVVQKEPEVVPSVEEFVFEEVQAQEQVPEALAPETGVAQAEEVSEVEEGEENFVVGDEGVAAGSLSAERYVPFVQQEIYRLWNPPVGVAVGTTAVLKVAVNPSGRIDDFEVITPSGCIIFDMSIERIADKFAFDSCLWGKTFTVEFRQ